MFGSVFPPFTHAQTGVGSYSYGVAYDFAKGEIFVANEYGNCLTVISDRDNSVITTIDLGNDNENNGVGMYPLNVAYDSAMGEIFVVDLGVNTIAGSSSASAGMVSVVSDATNTVIATIPVGADPTGIVYDSAKGEVFVSNAGTNPGDTSAANFNTGTVSVISDVTNSVVATVLVGPFPASAALAYDSGKSEFFVVTIPKSVSIISDSTNSVVGTKAAGSSPIAIAYDPAKSEIFVTNTDTDIVTILSDSTGGSTSTTPGSSASSALWILITVVIVIFAILVILFVLRKRKKNQPLPPPPPPQT